MMEGCWGSQPQSNAIVPNPASQRLGNASWSEAARKQDLLYVSHQDGSVAAYSYPNGALEGQLKDVRAAGLCSDQDGDVLFPTGNEILEYAHGGTRPIAVLHGSLGGAVQFCAVDPTTGNLAVSGGVYSKFGVAVYPNAQGSPKIYPLRAGNGAYLSSAYDDKGDLFVESATRNAVNVVELPKGAARFTDVSWIGSRPAGPGSVQWDGKYLAVIAADAFGSATVLRYNVQAGRAGFVAETPLKGAGDAIQSSIQGGIIVVPGPSGLAYYQYPGGGTPTAFVKDALGPQAATVSLGMKSGIDVVTYHYDNLRTGWDDSESSLTYQNVSNGSFGLIQSVTLDDQVDTQPLIVRGEKTTAGKSPGKHDVVYVATESNTVYAIEASKGVILFSTNLGSPVQEPLGCNNNGPNVGIDGTPVIDLAANVMYVITYTMVASVPTYTIHELSLSNLTDVVSPVVVAASHMLTNGTTYYFNATYQRQRPALLEANGNIYAGFGSFCDFAGSSSRGWLLGWQAGSLTPLAANQLNDALPGPPSFFLSSIWMSGDGVAADPSGNIYFVTGNSAPKTYNGDTAIQESTVKISADLTQLLSIFTPSDVNALDRDDNDFGSGGVLLLPTPSSSATPLAAAAGKVGVMFLMNRNSLGGYNKNSNDVLAQENIGGCWCGLSYFDAATDSLPRIVASGGDSVTVWSVQNSPSVKLSPAGSSPGLPSGQDSGFFTAVSSNGSQPGAIIWAVSRPSNVPGPIELSAFTSQASSSSLLQTLYQATGGYWDSTGGNSNVVPVVANAKVYVASYEQLDIFGLGGTKGAPTRPPGLVAYHPTTNAPHEITGTLLGISGSLLTLRSRTGTSVLVDDSAAVRQERSADLIIGEPFTARGRYDGAGLLHATVILRAKPSPSSWPPDRR